MKTFKQISTVFFFVLFLVGFNNSFAQIADVTEVNNSNLFLKAEVALNNTNDNSKINEFEPFESRSFYSKKINATITIILDVTGKKIESIEDSSNTFSKEQLNTIIESVNRNYASAEGDNCGCAWWELFCQVKCEMCKALGCTDE